MQFLLNLVIDYKIQNDRKMITKDNLRILLSCMGIAILFWLLNALGHDYTSQLDYPIKIIYKLPAKKRKRINKTPNKVKIEVNGKGWDLLKFKFKKPPSIKIVVGRYRSRSYFTNYELRKAFKKKIDNFTVNKVITRNIKVYE
ncbi:MAG: hypothetical protein GY830_07495 [Bacteroidetes bacterium]|nr:hypothetical protein [Bacteroidota bacterium]